ncbi:hypothetical protein SAMN02745181_0366 [Rubritalea squalenifaciens DSM 18772]|uniref:HEAT repeat-containing protein n=1 Tax=Rubritalea squalenifaciens DSM 18772 TaxID=1123071 RepID=A0A1M6C1X3_9BACT|nr:hypothetical protein [Rubritalea squalenifaciens]SHI55000.1 hypothetical protein SAMN02745181_0366 [Rubritalea squalenifaciens DSM 18772]
MNPRLPWLIAGSALCAAGLVVLMNRDLEHGDMPADDKAGSQAQRSMSGVVSAKNPAAQREARILKLIDRFHKLQESSASHEEKKTLAEQVCRELLFSPEMDQLLSEMERRGMTRIIEMMRSPLIDTLSDIHDDNIKAEALASLMEHPATISHFSYSYLFLEMAIFNLPDEDFKKLKTSLGKYSATYQNQAQFYYYKHHMRENPEKHFMEGFKLLDWENDTQFASYEAEQLTYQLSWAGRNIPYEQVIDQVHTLTADKEENSPSRDIVLTKLYSFWSSKDPQAALEHAQKISAAETYIKELATSVYQRKDSQEIVQWLDSIQDEATAEQARYIVARGLNADPVLSRIIAEGISDPERRAAAFKAIEAHERIRERRDARDFGTKIE